MFIKRDKMDTSKASHLPGLITWYHTYIKLSSISITNVFCYHTYMAKNSNKSSKYLGMVNTFGALTYIAILFQWLWASIILLHPLLVENSNLLGNNTSSTNTTIEIAPELTPLTTSIAIVVTIVVLVAIVIIAIKIPKRFSKNASHATHQAVNLILPKIAKTQKLNKKKKLKLSYTLTVLMKLIAVWIPLVAILFAPAIEGLPFFVISTLTLLFAGFSSLYIVIQVLLVKFLKPDLKKVW